MLLVGPTGGWLVFASLVVQSQLSAGDWSDVV